MQQRTRRIHWHGRDSGASRAHAISPIQNAHCERKNTSEPRELAVLLEEENRVGRIVVFTNGVFDILDAARLFLLQEAKRLGDVLVVGINSDISVSWLEGKDQPQNLDIARAELIAALDPVDYVVLFDEATPCSLIRELKPNVHVRRADTMEEEPAEIQAVREVGGHIVTLPLDEGFIPASIVIRAFGPIAL